MLNLAILLTSSHEDMINCGLASGTFESVCMVIGPNRCKRVLAAELTKFPGILRFMGLFVEVSIEVSSYNKNIPDREVCEDGVQGGPDLSSAIKRLSSCGGDFSGVLIYLDYFESRLSQPAFDMLNSTRYGRGT